MICGEKRNHTTHVFHDYHLRAPGSFSYFECSRCGCLQSEDPFSDVSSHYPSNYYSFAKDDKQTLLSRLKWCIRKRRNTYYRTGRGLIGKCIHAILPNTAIELFHTLNPRQEWSILDVGCGNDAIFLQHCADIGFEHLTGIDPYLPVPEKKIGAAVIRKAHVLDISGQFDLITLNHSFEHIPDQLETLSKCKSLLRPGGTIMLRIPTVSSMAWRTFGEYWANLDAPRHLFLHSRKSIRLLGDKCGLIVDKTIDDSNGFQFWGSALYRHCIPLGGTTSMKMRLIRILYRFYFSISKYRQIKRLNSTSDGDTFAVFLKIPA